MLTFPPLSVMACVLRLFFFLKVDASDPIQPSSDQDQNEAHCCSNARCIARTLIGALRALPLRSSEDLLDLLRLGRM